MTTGNNSPTIAMLRATIDDFETKLEWATQVEEEAQAALHLARTTPPPPPPLPEDGSTVYVSERPPAVAVPTAEFRLEKARREKQRISDELDAARACLARADSRDIAARIAAAEKNRSSADALFRKTGLFAALAQVKTSLPEIRKAEAEAAAAIEALPVDIRAAVIGAIGGPSRLAAFDAEQAIDHATAMLGMVP